MEMQLTRPVVLAATLVAAIVLTTGLLKGTEQAPGARPAPKATPPGAGAHPLLDGVWAYGTATPFERPLQFGEKAFFDTDVEANEFRAQARSSRRAQQAARLGVPEFIEEDLPFVSFAGRKPTSVILVPANGRIPYIAPQVQQRELVDRAEAADDIPLSERCLSSIAGPPLFPNVGLLYLQIFQTADYVVLVQEDLHDARVAPLDGRPHLPAAMRTWIGDSRGWWSGNKLIVETTNFHDRLRQRNPANRFDRNLRTLEQFSVINQNTLRYDFTVEDPTLFTQAWSGAFSMRRTNDGLFEAACHEGNYALANVLRGARVQERNDSVIERR